MRKGRKEKREWEGWRKEREKGREKGKEEGKERVRNKKITHLVELFNLL